MLLAILFKKDIENLVLISGWLVQKPKTKAKYAANDMLVTCILLKELSFLSMKIGDKKGEGIEELLEKHESESYKIF